MVIFRPSYQRLFSAAVGLGLTGTLAALAAVSPSEITLVSRPSGITPGQQANAASQGPVSLTSSGRLVAFTSFGRNLYALDNNSFSDIYIRDQSGNFTSIVSLGNPTGGSGSPTNNRVIANGDSRNPAISPTDGRFVAFESNATNLIEGDTNAATDVYLRDRFGDVVRASVSSGNAQGPNGAGSFAPSVSDPQQDSNSSGSVVYVAYHSDANNLDGAETNGVSDVFVTEVGPGFLVGSLRVNETRRISRATDGSQADGVSRNAVISRDGRYVVFESAASNLVEDDTNGESDIFLADLQADTIEIISAERDETGAIVNEADGGSYLPSLSADGRFIVYVSDATIHDPSDSGAGADVFIYDRLLNTTDRVSVDSNGDEGDGDALLLDSNSNPDINSRPTVSADGRYVVFFADSENLDTNDGNGQFDVFIHDRQDGETRRLSVSASLQEDGDSRGAAISANGGVVAFASTATNLITDDNNLQGDIFALETGGGGGSVEGQPVADAGAAQLAFELDTIILDGTASFDPEDDPLTYQWTQVEDPDAPTVTLDDPTSPTPTFQAPLVSQATILTFSLVVSDGVNTSEEALVDVLVDEAPYATISGTITDGNLQPLVGATVTVVREDGEEAFPVETDGAGNYEVQGVRVGTNTIVVSAEGFEPEEREITVGAGEEVDEDFTLVDFTGAVLGEVRLSNGSPVVDALVTLYDNQGEILAEDFTDDAGEYFLPDLDRFELGVAGTLVVEADGVPTWTTATFPRVESELNLRNFQYGRLEVTVDVNPSKQRNKLKGAVVTVREGQNELASGTVANANRRKLVFNNLPAVPVRVQASKAGLGAASANVTISEGGTTRTTVRIQRSSPF